ncbi:HEPN domain-containing protein [Geobacter sp.]|uniref:HEPN domain-containing protein n=1 Tax=Geobacter sp. TaxID=46610 RepID=UPI0027B953EF|nr:HEPN domain-containing protein [Geobacter sp.]
MIPEEIIEAAIRRLVERFDPERIILFGSQARGTADSRSDADFLVITQLTGRRRTLMLEMDRALRGLGLARDIVVLTPEEFERDRKFPGPLRARPPGKGRCCMSVTEADIQRKVNQWLNYADEDMQLARHALTLSTGVSYRLVAYHAQQCAEKSLKAYLVRHRIDFPYTHNISRLLELCVDTAPWGDSLLEASRRTSGNC